MAKYNLEAHQNHFGDQNSILGSQRDHCVIYAGFYVWLMTAAVACVVFLGEHVMHYIRGKIEARIARIIRDFV